jgi:hypothetical protein
MVTRPIQVGIRTDQPYVERGPLVDPWGDALLAGCGRGWQSGTSLAG